MSTAASTPSSQSSSVVGSSDPNFTSELGALGADYQRAWLAELIDLNQTQIALSSAAPQLYGCFLAPTVVNYLFTVCVRLQLPHDVRYTAALLFDQYMSNYLSANYTIYAQRRLHVEASNEAQLSSLQSEWSEFLDGVSRKVVIRLMTCVQLASKFVSYNDSISTWKLRAILRLLNQPYPLSAVFRSEKHVLDIVGFRIPPSPLVYIESMLGALTCTPGSPFTASADQYFQFAVLLLDYVFLHVDLCAQCLAAQRYPRFDFLSADEKNALLGGTRANWLRLAGEILVATSMMVHGSTHNTTGVLAAVAPLVRASVSELRTASMTLIRAILADQTDAPGNERNVEINPTRQQHIPSASLLQSREKGETAAEIPIPASRPKKKARRMLSRRGRSD